MNHNYDTMPLPETTPEKAGISRRHVLDFLDSIEQKRLNLHSFIMLRGGKIFAEGYWKPYHSTLQHRLYSVSKSFTSTAIGFLADEGKISLDDRVASYFPEYDAAALDERVAKCTIRDLLIMASPFTVPAYVYPDGSGREEWIKSFFTVEPDKEPGTHFDYDTCGTYMLCVIVERVSGKDLVAYLREKVLDEIGFTSTVWCVKSPEDHCWGGSGIMGTARDLAKFAQFWLQGGVWNGKRLLSEEFVKAATSKQIEVPCPANEYQEGYGYQIWKTKGGFSFLGMGSQAAIFIPEKNFIFVCTGDTQGHKDDEKEVFDCLWQHIIPNLGDGEVTDYAFSAERELKQKLESLKLPVVEGLAFTPYIDRYHNAEYTLEENPMGIKKTTLCFDGKYGLWKYENAQGEKKLRFGIGHNVEDRFPQSGYNGRKIFTPKEDGFYICQSSAAWVTPNHLRMTVYATDDHLGNLTADFIFSGDNIEIKMSKNAEWFFDEYTGTAVGTRG